MRFLVDVNLPKFFSHFNSPSFSHVADINPKMSDLDVWEYAKNNQQVILTKDADFHTRYLNSESGPKVIYFQLGDASLQQLHNYFTINWQLLQASIEVCDFIVAKKDTIETLNRRA